MIEKSSIEEIRERFDNYVEIFSNIETEQVSTMDLPCSLNYQMDLMKKVGFSRTEILHKNLCFAAYCGMK